MASLEIERKQLDEASTWPWHRDTLRWVVGALMFPIVLFVAQLVIQRVVAS